MMPLGQQRVGFRLRRALRGVLSLLWSGLVVQVVASASANILTTKTSDISGTVLVWLLQHELPVMLGVVIVPLLIWFFDRGEPKTDPSNENDELSREGFLHTLASAYNSNNELMKTDIPINFQLVRNGQKLQNASKTIYDWYKDHAEPSLLILGDAGVGKTVQIYTIARACLEEAKKNKSTPLPVVLRLSSWTNKRLPLDEWIIAALRDTYKIPHAMGRNWLGKNRLRLFLDGLDEVAGEAQVACIQAINAYITDDSRTSLVPIVISTRLQEYQRQQVRLDINDQIVILPLTLPQVRHYLRTRNLSYVLQSMENNTQLQEILCIPLILSMVANIDETLSAGPQAASWRRNFLQRLTSATSRSISVNEVFEQYLAVHISSFDTSIQQEVRNHLIWLAKQMNKRHQGDFYLEGLQKDWLEDKHLQPVEQLQIRYQRWGVFGLSCILGASLNLVLNNIFGLSDIPYILIYALLGGLVGGLLVQENNAKHPLRSQLATGLLQGVIVTAVVTSSYLLYVADHSMTWHDWWHNVIVYAPVFGVCTLLLHLLKTMGWIVNSRQAARSMALSRIPLKLLQGRLFQKLQQIKLRYISNGILVGLVIAIGITLSDGLTDGPMHLWDDTARDFVLFVLTTSILSFGLARAKVSEEIQPVDIRSFSLSLLWQRLTSLQHMLISMIIGVSTFWVLLFTSGLDTGFVETFQNQHGQGITYGFEAALIYWLLFGFYSSLSSNTIPRDWGRFPNQSIKLSGCNGLMFGISFGCLWWLITICAGLNQGIAIAIQAGKTYGLLVGLAGGLFFWHDAWGYRIYSALPFTPFPCKNRYHHIPLY